MAIATSSEKTTFKSGIEYRYPVEFIHPEGYQYGSRKFTQGQRTKLPYEVSKEEAKKCLNIKQLQEKELINKIKYIKILS